MVSALLGCALRRAEGAALYAQDLPQHEEHWVIHRYLMGNSSETLKPPFPILIFVRQVRVPIPLVRLQLGTRLPVAQSSARMLVSRQSAKRRNASCHEIGCASIGIAHANAVMVCFLVADSYFERRIRPGQW